MKDDKGRRVHWLVPEMGEQLRKGQISRREFVQTAALLGVSAGAAYAMAGGIAGTGAAWAQGKAGGTLRCAMQVQEMTDPAIFDWTEKSNVARHMGEYLTITGPDNITRPYLAESWEPSDDLKTWTFKLRKGVLFGNGQEMTADDVIYNVERWLAPETGSSIQGLLNAMVTESEGKDKDGKPITLKKMTEGAVEKVDDHTIRFHLNEADLAMPEKMYHYPSIIVHRSFDEAGGNISQTPELLTGPYTLSDFAVGEKAVLVRRPGIKYWGEAPLLNEIVYIDTGEDASAGLAALASDQVDVVYLLDLTILEAAEAIPGVKVSAANTSQTGVIRMQVDAKPFDDLRIRQAIQLASNNQANFEASHRGLGSIGENHHVCDCQPDYSPMAKPKQDLDKAKELLQAAGVAGDLKLTCNVGNTQGSWEQDSVVALKQDLAKAGIDLEVNVMPSAQYWEVWDKADFSLTSWAHRPLGTMNLGLAYRTGVPWNETHYANPEFDKALAEAESTIDLAERRKSMAKCQKMLQDDAI
ncbi:MAG: ABC transporter substrate-binding protein, partial [Rhodospirillaceae bacterium]|nr:ABC transporter substrate-binding protein [Rhodospirillaceae bacterium]